MRRLAPLPRPAHVRKVEYPMPHPTGRVRVNGKCIAVAGSQILLLVSVDVDG
jgi:hypothetical protein